MIGRIATWIFYAVFFFLVGVWAGPRLPAVDGIVASIVGWGYDTVGGLQKWALADDPAKPAEPAQPAAPAAPEAPKTPEAPHGQPAATPSDLQDAREAWGKGDVAGAMAAYEDFLLRNPDDIDARGEYGNALYTAGRFPEAARVFYDVALRLHAKGETAKAKALEPAVRRGDAALADELVKLLAGGGTHSSNDSMKMAPGQDVIRVAVQ